MPTRYDDEFYRDILEGLALYDQSDLQRDVLRTLTLHQEPRIGAAFNKNQVASKIWLLDTLAEQVGSRFGEVMILGGWIGVLGAMLLDDARFAIGRITSIDIDPACAPVAECLNARHAAAGRFEARTADMLDVDYTGAAVADQGAPTLIINTSSEHLAEFDRWYARIPAGPWLALQSNDYFACDEHVNSVASLAAFQEQAPLAHLRFAGERRLRRYTRFMLIGRK